MQLFSILNDVFSTLFTFVHFEDFLITNDINYSKVQLVVKHWADFQSTVPDVRDGSPLWSFMVENTLYCISLGSMTEFSSLVQSHGWPLYINL